MAIGHGVTGQFGQLTGANAITAHELGAHAQGLHLLEHGAGHGVHAAKKHHIGLFALEGGQDGHEVGGFVVGEFATHDGAASGLDGLFKLIGHALSVSGAVIDNSDVFALHGFDRITAQGTAQVHIVGHHTEGGFVALAGEFGVGGRGRDLGNAGIAVNFGRRNRGARIEVANHAVDLAIDQFLRRGSALFGVGRIVFGDQFKFHLGATNADALGIQVFNGQTRTVLVVFAQVGNGATDGAHMANFHHGLGLCRHRQQSGRSQEGVLDQHGGSFQGVVPNGWCTKYNLWFALWAPR